MFFASDTGPIGFIMNVLATASFCCTASFVYKKIHTKKGAIVGLTLGVIMLTAVMLLWNYLITPIYQGLPRETVAAMLPTVFLPFNVVKGGLNMALILVLYKPVVTALRKARAGSLSPRFPLKAASWAPAICSSPWPCWPPSSPLPWCSWAFCNPAISGAAHNRAPLLLLFNSEQTCYTKCIHFRRKEAASWTASFCTVTSTASMPRWSCSATLSCGTSPRRVCG